MWDYLYKNLVAENLFLQSVANIVTPIGIFLGIFSFWYSRRKTKLNNKPMIEFLHNEYHLIRTSISSDDQERYILDATEIINGKKGNSDSNFLIKCSNDGLNSMFIKKIKIDRIPFFRWKKADFTEIKEHILHEKNVEFFICNFSSRNEIGLKILNSNSTSHVRVGDQFNIILHPVLNHFIVFSALEDYLDRDDLNTEFMTNIDLLFKKKFILTLKISYEDINRHKYFEKIDVYTNIEPEKSKYKLRIICKRR